MFLSRRSNGYYYLWYDKKGKRMKISCKTKKKSEALLFLSHFKKELEEREPIIKEIKLIDFQIEFIEYSFKNHKEKTTQGFKNTFNFFSSYLPNKYLSEITYQDCFNYIQSRIDKIYQARKDLINLKSSFNYAVNKNYIEFNPFHKIKSIKIPDKTPRFFSKDEFDKLAQTITNNDLRDLTIFAVNTGLRQMELINLTWAQIIDNYVHVNNWDSLSKTNKVRSVPLNNSALEILEQRNKRMKFIFNNKGNKWTQNWLSKYFNEQIKKSGLDNKLNFHSLRHTFASWLIQAGVSIYHVSKLLGHSSIRTTEIYSHLRKEDLMSSVSKL